MLIPGQNINAFKHDNAGQCASGSWFTGKMNTQVLDFDPLVTGYAFFVWTKLPFWVEDTYKNFKHMTQKNFKAFEGIQDIELQTAQYTHTFNANAYEYATSIQKGNTNFSIRHQEFSGNPIKNMYSFWVTGIRDPETDIALYPRAFGCEYAAKNHTGELLYIVTRPDANNTTHHNIEFAAYYTAVMPTKVPIGHFGYNQGDHNSPEIDINFVGDFHIGPEVDDFAASVLNGQNAENGGIVSPYSFITSALFSPTDRTRGDGANIFSDISSSYMNGYNPTDHIQNDEHTAPAMAGYTPASVGSGNVATQGSGRTEANFV